MFVLRDDIKQKYADSYLQGIAPTDLTIYANQEEFDAQKPLIYAFNPISTNGTPRFPLIVVIPSQISPIVKKQKTVSTSFPFKPVHGMTDRMNVQYRRLGYCQYLAEVFKVALNFENLPFRDFDVTSYLFSQIMKALLGRGIKRVIFDEAQRQLGLIEFIAKEGANRPVFLITGTPHHGENSIDYGGTVVARMAMVKLSDLRPPEVKQLVQAIFESTVTSTCILNFWTLFGGDPYLYQLFAKVIFVQLEVDVRSSIADGEKFPSEVLQKCIAEARNAFKDGGISPDLFNAIPSVKRKDIQAGFQKDVTQLLNRELLKKIPYFSSPKEFRICWADYNEGPNIIEKSWARCRGYAMENIIRNFVEEALLRGCGNILNLPSNRYELCEYFYDGTDADILLREKDPSLDDFDVNWKRHWVLFNIKSNSESLLHHDSVQKFTLLCKAISKKENEEMDNCSLILVAATIDESTKPELFETWNGFDILGAFDLEYFFNKLPQPAIKTKDGLALVERLFEKQRLETTQHNSISLSGKYRCGKTTLLKDCYGEDKSCLFLELPAIEIEPLSLEE